MANRIIHRDAPYRREETALLFVDMQVIFCTPGRDPAHPDRDPDHYFHRRLSDTVIPNQIRLLEAARGASIQVMHTTIEALTLDGRDISLDHRLSGIFIPKGHPEGRPVPELSPADNE
ncbi:MAG: cysteine hydrolase family protein, partial [Hyphomicrobiales bacterium]